MGKDQSRLAAIKWLLFGAFVVIVGAVLALAALPRYGIMK